MESELRKGDNMENKYKQALQDIASLWPESPNCADILGVYGINDGKSRAILLDAAIKMARKALHG